MSDDQRKLFDIMDIMAQIEDEPIAAKIVAEPGWRACFGDPLNFDAIKIVPVEYWAVLPPDLQLVDSDTFMELMSGEFEVDIEAEIRQKIPSIWPLNTVTGKPIMKNLFGVYGPTDFRSDDEILKSVKSYVEEVTDKLLDKALEDKTNDKTKKDIN